MEYLLPYQLQYPSVHSEEYLAPLQEGLQAPSLFHRSCHESQLSPSQYRREARLPPCPYEPRCNERPLDHLHPLNQSYPDLPLAYNASSKVVPSLPLHHKLMSHRVGDIYPLLHQRYALTLLLHVVLSNHFYTSHKEFDDAPVSNHLSHLEEHDR